MPNPKHAAGLRIGIVNPLTLVGNEIKTILRQRAFPYDRLVLLDSSGKTAGALTDVGDEPAVVTAISDDELEDLDLVFFCGSAEANREWLQRADDVQFIAVDLAQPTAAEEGRLVVAGINLEELDDVDRRVLVSPHPIAIPIALILHQLGLAAPIELCTATVVQPASAFDQEGVEELAQQTLSVLNVRSVPHEIFDRQLAFNLYPALEHQEEAIVAQIRALTKASELALLVTQGTIFHSHTFSLFVKLAGAPAIEPLIGALKASPAIAFAEGDQQFGTIDAAGRDEVLVAEVRPDPSIRGGFWVWAVCDNLRRSSALNAVLIAEKALFGSGPAN
jgi:aspartate-semialdehyde dehydrogenase